MAGTDLVFDPVTGDVVDDGLGGFVETDGADTAVYLQFCTELDGWVMEQDLGCKAHLVQRKNNMTTGIELKACYQQAYEPLVADGRIADPVVTVDRDKLNRIAIRTSARDAQRGVRELSDLIPFTPGDF